MASRLPPSSSRRAGDGWKINKQQTNNKQINKQTNKLQTLCFQSPSMSTIATPILLHTSHCLLNPPPHHHHHHNPHDHNHAHQAKLSAPDFHQNSPHHHDPHHHQHPPPHDRNPPDLTSIYLLICQHDHLDHHPGETLCPRSYFPPTGLHLRVSPPLTHSVSLPECS